MERVVLADWLFTTPTIILQPVTGLRMAVISGWPLTQGWVVWAIGLYLLAGACWLPVVVLQLRMRTQARLAAAGNTALPECYWRDARLWFWLGVPAFSAVIAVYALMVFKPV